MDKLRKADKRTSVNRDHAEQYPTDTESLFDRFPEEATVDPIPVEDLTLQMEDEREKERTKSDSSSERKYR